VQGGLGWVNEWVVCCGEVQWQSWVRSSWHNHECHLFLRVDWTSFRLHECSCCLKVRAKTFFADKKGLDVSQVWCMRCAGCVPA
jgi:hypothetical protein